MPVKYEGAATGRFSGDNPVSKRIFDEQPEKIEVKAFEKMVMD